MPISLGRAANRAVLVNARVYRAPGDPQPADAIAIHDGRIQSVGARDEMPRGAETGPVIDLRGRTVLPAFIDSHTHFHRGAILRALYLDFETLRPASVGEVLGHVAERAATLPAGAWLQGDSLSGLRLAEARLPDRRELDRVAPHNPVVLRGIGKHVVAANSAALVAAGIDRDTADPPGGRIERDADGTPTGILHERAKLRLDQSHPETVVPSPSEPDRRRALCAGIRDLHRAGIATIHEMVRLTEEAADLSALRADGELGVRVRLYYRVHESPIALDWLVGLGIRRRLGDDWLRVEGVKISVDGFCIFRNAAVHEPYPGRPDDRGLLRIEPDRLDELVRTANAQGLNVAVHAVGARAVDLALDAFERAGSAVAGPHRLEHAYIDMDEPRLRRTRDLGLIWSVQPAFVPAYAREWTAIFGADRADAIMPLALGDELGIPMLYNSDFPCVPFDPLDGIRAAVGRKVEGGTLGARHAITLERAWHGFTTAPADLTGDARIGRLEVGRHADLVVFDEDPFDHGTDLALLSVRATMVDGTFVHGGGEMIG